LVVGFQVFSVDYPSLRRLLPQVRSACPDALLIAGGAHVTSLSEQSLRDNPDLDLVIRGEGEEPLRQLCQALQAGEYEARRADIPNLSFREGEGFHHTHWEYADVKKWGAPAWDILRPDLYPPIQQGMFHKSTRVVPILTSRGCPHPCTFCAGHTITGRKIRLRDVDDVLDEIEALIRDYGVEEFIVQDENFSFYKDRVLQFSEGVRKRGIRRHFSFPSGLRMDKIDEEIIAALRAMGAYMVTLGIESGSPKTLKAMRKNWKPEMVLESVELLRRHGITVLGCFILGFPGETMDDIRQTIDFALKSKLQTAYFGNFLPLPGSAEFERMIESGELELEKINWDAYTTYFGTMPYHPKDVSAEQLRRAVRSATLRFYLRPGIMLGLLRRMTHPIFIKSLLFRAWRVFAG
jgi:radical SAM superfamily enzyme YgiQ (UPF0313 family)